MNPPGCGSNYADGKARECYGCRTGSGACDAQFKMIQFDQESKEQASSKVAQPHLAKNSKRVSDFCSKPNSHTIQEFNSS